MTFLHHARPRARRVVAQAGRLLRLALRRPPAAASLPAHAHQANPHRALAELLARGDDGSARYADLCLKADLINRYRAARPDLDAMAAEPALAARYADATGQPQLLARLVEIAVDGFRRGTVSKRELACVLRRGWRVDPERVEHACDTLGLARPPALALAAGPARALELARGSGDPDLLLAAANACDEPGARLAHINAALASLGQAPIVLREPGRMPGLRQLSAAAPVPPPVAADRTGPPRVSVIMTCFDAAPYLEAAIDSVLGQSWYDLELLVVDDASLDDSWAIVQAAARADTRVQAIRLARNAGTYAAKNHALARASGEFVAFNDADDWSHPDRLAAALRRLAARPSLVAVSGRYVRIDDDGRFTAPRTYPLIRASTNSLVFRRVPVLRCIGWFDENRFGGDSEYAARLRVAFGEDAHERLPQIQWMACRRAASLMHGGPWGLDANGSSAPRRAFENEWGERLLVALCAGTGLYLPRGVARAPRLLDAAAGGGGVEHGAPVDVGRSGDAG